MILCSYQNMSTNLLCYILFTFIYGCCVWGLTSEENLSKIEILQKKCIRIISFSDFGSHINQVFVTHNVLKFLEIIKLNHLQLLYNFLNDSLPTDLKSLFK